MSLLESTYRSQSALAKYCRTGNYTPLKGVNQQNIDQYRRLVFSIVDDMLISAYPLSHALLSAPQWTKLIKAFFSEHGCMSPQVWQMPHEFYTYFSSLEHPLKAKYPFLCELLWFEWLEIYIYMMADQPSNFRPTGDLKTELLVINPEHHLQHFKFPVHLKQAKKIHPEDQNNYYLAIHRMPETGQVHFTNLAPAPVRILELLAEQPSSLTELTQQICEEMQIPYSDEMLLSIQHFIQEALKSQLVLGFN